jgi:hypothetical protein
LGRRLRWFCATLGLLTGCAGLFSSTSLLPRYTLERTLAPGVEWRFYPVVVDLKRNGHSDIVATSRLSEGSLHIWLGDGKTFTRLEPTWSEIGYGAPAIGDINHDGFPDIVVASHFGRFQTLLSDGKGGFTEQIADGIGAAPLGGRTQRAVDGYAGAALADVNGDGELDLILLGNLTAGIEIYLGDGKGNWRLHTRLPETRPGRNMPGRALAVGDLNHDGHPDLVVAFQRYGLYIYYGDGQGGFSGGAVDVLPPAVFGTVASALVLADVNKDGHPDIVVNGSTLGTGTVNGPDVLLGDGRGGWKASSDGLKVLSRVGEGLAVGDLDGDGNLDIVAGGNLAGDPKLGYGLFWFRGDGKGGWNLVRDSGLPTRGLAVPHGIALADLERDGPQIIVLHGGTDGSITIWKRQ